MAKPLWVEVQEKPLTAALVAACVCIWLWLNQRGWGYPNVGTSFQKVVEERQYWRLLTSQFSHIEFMHLLLNMSSLWSLGIVEKTPRMGSLYYLKVTVILLIFSKALLMLFYLFMVKVLKMEYYRSVVSVGYSSVVFGWMSSLSVGKQRLLRFRMMGLSSIPMAWAPIGSLILTSILIPRVSFFGHLSGVLVGYLIGFGYFDWLNIYWSVTLCFWLLLGVAVNLVQNGSFNLPFVRYPRDDEILIVRELP